MSQGISGLGLGASGIVGTLVVAGIILYVSNISPGVGQTAISGGVLIGVALGVLGVLGVAKRVLE
ncbi:hypothetical protein HYU16_05470 [Candidatus Woesearchaeota archaeon]|nr:hypothetical protein [Candidatus Woesearchaeota archaeon]